VTGRRLLPAAFAEAAVGLVASRLAKRSGTTDAEVRARLPGDELVPDPLWVSTRAITVAAEPSAVWPWIVQMGFPSHRAGWYTPHTLDRLQWGIRERSSDTIRPELQGLRVADRIPDSRDWSVFFTVAALEPERALVLHSTRHVLKPMRSIDFSWAFVLEPAAGGATRLLIRARARCEPGWSLLVLGPLLGLGDFVNASVMLRGIKAPAELRDGVLALDGGGTGEDGTDEVTGRDEFAAARRSIGR
jgi:hypothetical protein